MGRSLARLNAGTAADAQVGRVEQLPVEAPGLGVVAPEAVERAAFEEDRGPYARAVVRGEALDVEDQSRNHYKPVPPAERG